jgi:hypothetical protein
LSLHRRSIRAQCRSNWTDARNLTADDLGPTREDAHQTFRVRKDGTRKDLPLPPLLDPVIVEERSRWEVKKVQPKDADLTPFQKKLLLNPFGKSIDSVHKEAVLIFPSKGSSVASPPMSLDSHLAPCRISDVSTCSPTSYDQRSLASSCLADHGREAPRASV